MTLYWLALGAFAIGTESFMIAGLLPVIAADLSVSVAMAGQLVTAFAFSYALSSPILAALTGNLNRRRLLIAALACFAVANFLACTASGYWSLMASRILLAVAAGVYLPSANALAGSLLGPERRGRALAVVHSGLTIAIVLGAPLGAIVGDSFGWRVNFAGVGVLAALVATGLSFGVPSAVGAALPNVSLLERLSVMRRPELLFKFFVTTLWAAGVWTMYPYLAPFLARSLGIDGAFLAAVLFLYGLSTVGGVLVGGYAIDRFGSGKVCIGALLVLGLAYFSLSISARVLSIPFARIAILLAIVVWGIAGFMFSMAQQAKLISSAGAKLAPISLSLNASFLYLGFSLGAVLGSLLLELGAVTDIGWVAGSCEFGALALMIVGQRYSSARVSVAEMPSPHFASAEKITRVESNRPV